jgi:hypothetical protein
MSHLTPITEAVNLRVLATGPREPMAAASGHGSVGATLASSSESRNAFLSLHIIQLFVAAVLWAWCSLPGSSHRA